MCFLSLRNYYGRQNMGTNFYVVFNECSHCGRYDNELHIGKSSFGWCFHFQGYKHLGLVSWQDWKEYLKDKVIKDEYGDTMDYSYFVNLIETYKSPNYVHENGHKNLQHNFQGRIDKLPWFDPQFDWDDEEGYPFGSREFS